MNEMLAQCQAMMDAMTGCMWGHSMEMPGMMAMGDMMSPAVWLLGLVSVALVAVLGVGIGWLFFGRSRRVGEADARHLLDRRYAGSELDRDTYLRMRSDLGDSRPKAG